MNSLERAMNKLMGKKNTTEDTKMALKSRDLGDGKYEVNGVIMYADSHPEAILKYRKGTAHGR